MRVVSTCRSRSTCPSAALNRAASKAGSLVTSLTHACASCGCVVTLPLPYISSANPTYPASARRRAWLRACSLCPHHSCTTSTPGRLPRAASSQATNPCNTVSLWRYSISRVFTVALPADRVSKTAVMANPYRVCMPRPPGGWYRSTTRSASGTSRRTPSGSHRSSRSDRTNRARRPTPRRGSSPPGRPSSPAAPRLRRVGVAVGERLVEQVEDHAIVALVRRGDLPPELRRVVAVRHRGLAERLARIGGPVQVQDHDEPGAVRQRDVVGDSTAVVGPRVGGGDAVDAEPAGLVQGQAHHIRLPGCDRLHGRRVGRSIEDAPALRAGVFRPGAVHPAQPHRSSGGVHQSGTLHVHRGGTGGRGGRGGRRRSAARGS